MRSVHAHAKDLRTLNVQQRVVTCNMQDHIGRTHYGIFSELKYVKMYFIFYHFGVCIASQAYHQWPDCPR